MIHLILFVWTFQGLFSKSVTNFEQKLGSHDTKGLSQTKKFVKKSETRNVSELFVPALTESDQQSSGMSCAVGHIHRQSGEW